MKIFGGERSERDEKGGSENDKNVLHARMKCEKTNLNNDYVLK